MGVWFYSTDQVSVARPIPVGEGDFLGIREGLASPRAVQMNFFISVFILF
jgi:hypothetical protein